MRLRSSVWMAMKGKMELTIGIAVGSSIVSISHLPVSLKKNM